MQTHLFEQVCLICLYDFFYFIYEDLFDKLFQNMLFNRLVSTFVFVYTCILANLCCTISLMFCLIKLGIKTYFFLFFSLPRCGHRVRYRGTGVLPEPAPVPTDHAADSVRHRETPDGVVPNRLLKTNSINWWSLSGNLIERKKTDPLFSVLFKGFFFG